MATWQAMAMEANCLASGGLTTSPTPVQGVTLLTTSTTLLSRGTAMPTMIGTFGLTSSGPSGHSEDRVSGKALTFHCPAIGDIYIS